MKKELAFAIVLLALGAALWMGRSKSVVPAWDAVASVLKPVISPTDHQGTETNQVTRSPGQLPSSLLSPQASSQFVHEISDPQTVKLLATISESIANSMPLSSSINMTGTMFGHSVSATGNYYQLGQGTSKSRIELKFGPDPAAASVFQLCDGRFVYRLQMIGSQRSLEFVDLKRVQEKTGETATRISPTGWVATGGISSLFQHLASAFNFGAPERIDDSTVLIRGSWELNALQQTVAGSNWALTNPVRWDELPAQVPHAVEITFQADKNYHFFPKQITFLKFKTLDEQQMQLQPAMSLSFSSPQHLANATDQMFVVDSSNLSSQDTTDNYIARIEAYNEIRRAANDHKQLDR